MPETTRERNGRGEKHYDFNPIENFDADAMEPDAAPGEYNGIIEDVEVRKSGEGWPQLRIEVKLDSTNTDSEEAEKSVGATLSDFITFRPEGDKKGNFSKRRLRLYRDKLEIPDDAIPTRIESKRDFDDLVDFMKGKELPIWVRTELDKETKEPRARLELTAPRSAMGALPPTDNDEEEEEAPKPAPRRAAAKPAARKPAASARRR